MVETISPNDRARRANETPVHDVATLRSSIHVQHYSNFAGARALDQLSEYFFISLERQPGELRPVYRAMIALRRLASAGSASKEVPLGLRASRIHTKSFRDSRLHRASNKLILCTGRLSFVPAHAIRSYRVYVLGTGQNWSTK